MNRLDTITDALALRMKALVDGIPEATVPFQSKALTKREQMERYLEIRNDPQKWVEMIQKQGMKPVIDYVRDMEKNMEAVNGANGRMG